MTDPIERIPETEEKRRKKHKYLWTSITLFAAAALAIVFYFLLDRFPNLVGILSDVADLLRPIIIGAVLFAAWRAGSAVYHLLHFRRQKSPVLLSAKALSLSAALLSLFALQGTLLSRFGRSLVWRAAWNGISGTFIGVLLTVMALMMLGKGKKRTPD